MDKGISTASFFGTEDFQKKDCDDLDGVKSNRSSDFGIFPSSSAKKPAPGDFEVITATDLAKLVRSRSSNGPVAILDCRSINAYRKGHCVSAEHVGPPPTLWYHRMRKKPDFWSSIRQRLIIPDHNQNGEASKIVLIDDDDQFEITSNCVNGSRNRSVQQSFSSFLLSNLRLEGRATFLLKGSEMTRFLVDYPDLSVLGQSGEDDKDNDLASRVALDATRRPCDGVNRNGVSSLSQRQSSTGKPFLLPLLKIKDLTLDSDSTTVADADETDPIQRVGRGGCGSQSKLASFDYRNGDAKFADRDPVNIFATLYLGNAENAGDLETLRRYNIKYILNATSDLPNRFQDADDGESFKYLRIPVVDNVSSNLVRDFPVANDFIDEAIRKGVGVLVHCLAGVSRSVTFTVAYLMKAKSWSLDEAYDFVKTRKPNVEPNLNFMRQLFEYKRSLDSDSGGATPDSVVSSLSTSSSSSICVEPIDRLGMTSHLG